MPQVKSIERKIRAFEGFDVRITDSFGTDVRSDKQLPVQYDDYSNRAADNMTVESWRRVRFRSQFAGYDVDVLDGKGSPVHGGTHLATVRASY